MKSLRPVFLLLLFSFPLLIAAQTKQVSNEPSKQLSNELIWSSREFSSESVRGVNSMNDGIHYSSLERGGEGPQIVKYQYATGKKVGVIVSSNQIFGDSEKQIQGYEFSADEKKLLIQTDVEGIYRHSTKANYYIYDLELKRRIPLADFKMGKQRLGDFSPKGDQVAFVRENNLFVYDLSTKTETRITEDGVMNQIINGATDWVYEEEFGFDKGFYWSPNGDRIAYYRFDEAHVKEFQMATYGDLYPDQYKFKYPKAGEDNADVAIYIHDLNKKRSKKVDIGREVDIYIPRIKWTLDNDRLCVMKMNRHQNELEFLMTHLGFEEPFSLKTRSIYKETSDTYIPINDNLIFLKDGNGFLWNSLKDGYNHIYLHSLDGRTSTQLTSGNWDVIEFLGVDEKKGVFYYTSSQESPLEQHLYAKGITKRIFKKLSTEKGTNSAVFSKTFQYYINYHSDANSPSFISMHDSKGNMIRVLKDNSELKETLGEYKLGTKEFFTFTNSAGIDLNCWMIKPPNFQSRDQYPVFVTIYGGPGHNTVTDSWGGTTGLWHHMMAQQGYIVVSCDPRGTMYRGRDFEHSTYLQLGKLETEDFIDFANHLSGLPYVDRERIGIQGWSYGGYMSSLCMTKGADHYKMGIAVAPVTNWRYYDTIYTERFMRTPQENADGYDDNSPINHVEKLKGKYLLVHGSADDNVHYQNTMEMINALVAANKQFDLFIYPDRNHGIYGGNTRLHLFDMMTKYILENL